MSDRSLSRRDFVRAAGGTATMAAAGAAGTASAQQQPEFPSYLDGAKGGNFKDLRGKKEVTVKVGADPQGLAFAPTKIWIDPGTKVTFEWVSTGHNVVPKSIPDGASWEGSGSSLESKGYTYSHTFETKGIYTYYCAPHEGAGMKGGIAVGGGGGSGGGGGGGGGASGPPKWPSYVEGAKGGAYKDLRGKKEVTVEVGAGSQGLAFSPTKIWIDKGTKVTFEWVSSGHNVLPNSQPEGAGWEGSGSSLESEGYTYSHTFGTGGMYTYYCKPHEGSGMKGAIAVGSNVPTAGGSGELPPIVPQEAMTVVVAAMGAMGATLSLAYFYLKYGGNATRNVEA